jgi:hypothetical protein
LFEEGLMKSFSPKALQPKGPAEKHARKYSPHTSGGRQLLAHELAHTVQQAGPMAQRVQRTEKVTLKTQLTSQMLKTLTKPSGMNSPTEFVP